MGLSWNFQHGLNVQKKTKTLHYFFPYLHKSLTQIKNKLVLSWTETKFFANLTGRYNYVDN